jgi:hypothetical protein
MKYREPKKERGKFYVEEFTRRELEAPLERRLQHAFTVYRPDVNVYFGRGCIFVNGFKVYLQVNKFVMRLNYEGELVPFNSTAELLEYFNEHNFCKLSKADIAYIDRHSEQYHNTKKAQNYEQRFHKK